MSSAEISAESDPRIYDRVFFCSYFANVFMLVAVSLLFRYSDFVESIGGTEWHLGWIVGLGTIGAIIFRAIQGAAIDRLGPILIWSLSLIGFALANLLHVQIDDVSQWAVYFYRFLMNLCIAGVFGSWLSFVSLRVPSHRVAEAIGVVGSSGFIGMATGPVIGDWIFSRPQPLADNVDMMFYTAAWSLMCALACTLLGGWLAVQEGSGRGLRPARRESNKPRPTIWSLLQKYHPGFLLVVAAIMGQSIMLPGIFLRPFAAEQGIEQIKLFFLVYNGVAFVSRVTFRRAPEKIGLRNAILIGLLLMALSMASYLLVNSTITLIIPAIAGGLAHSFLFPSVVAGGTAFFPKENRGLATSLVLAMYDFGVLVGSPLVGISVTSARHLNLPEYPLTFCMVSLILFTIALVLWWRFERGDGSEIVRRRSNSPPGGTVEINGQR